MSGLIGKLMCRFGYHDWNLMFRRVGEDQPCRRGCGAIAIAARPGPDGWDIRQGA